MCDGEEAGLGRKLQAAQEKLWKDTWRESGLHSFQQKVLLNNSQEKQRDQEWRQ